MSANEWLDTPNTRLQLCFERYWYEKFNLGWLPRDIEVYNLRASIPNLESRLLAAREEAAEAVRRAEVAEEVASWLTREVKGYVPAVVIELEDGKAIVPYNLYEAANIKYALATAELADGASEESNDV